MNFSKCVFTILVIVTTAFLLTLKVKSQSVTFSVGVLDASMEFLGYTSPNAFITFKEGSSVIGTTTADTLGYYYKNFTAVSVGIHTVSLFSTDITGVNTPEFTYEIVVLPTQITSVAFDFPPTLKILNSSFTNENVLVNGLAKPNSNITLNLDGSGIQNFFTTSNTLGEIRFIIDKQYLPSGNFSLNAYLSDSIDQSLSNTLIFSYNPGVIVIPESPIKNTGEQISSIIQEYIWAPLAQILNGGKVQGETITSTTLDSYLQNTFLLVASYLVIITSAGIFIVYKLYGPKR